MPRYFFDVYDGSVTRDDEGQEMQDLDAARREAMASLPSIAADEIPINGDRRSFVVVVRDENQRPVYTATLGYIGLKLI